jgi:hypothetical protein
MLKCELVPVMLVDSVFGRCAEGFQRAAKKASSDVDAAFLYRECRSGNAMLVIAHDDEVISGALVIRYENWCGKNVMHTLGLWCSAKGAYQLLESKKIELAKMSGATALIAEARASKAGLCGFKRRYPKAKILRYVIEVELE